MLPLNLICFYLKSGYDYSNAILLAFRICERELIVERTRAGLDAARLQGRIGGRKRLMTQDVLFRAEAMLATGATRLQVANVVGVSEKPSTSTSPRGEMTAFLSSIKSGLIAISSAPE